MDVPDRSSLSRRPSSSEAPGGREALPRTVAGLAPLSAEFHEVLDAGLAAIPLELDPEQRSTIEDHVRLLLAWNEHMNLSGLRTPADIARGHVLDALICVPVLRTLHTRSLADIGSGGGFPGLPLALALPVERAALVDSIAKKAAFLEAAAALVARPEIVAIAERAEDLADEPDQREAWDLVTARAVGTVAESAEIALPLARRGGNVAIWKRGRMTPALREELGAAARVIQACGGARARVLELDAAAQIGLSGNCLVLIRKVRPTPDRYPRQPGERRRAALA